MLPVAYAADLVPLPLFPALWLLAVGSGWWLARHAGFGARQFLGTRGLRAELGRLLLPVVVALPLLVGLTFVVVPERLFGLVRERPLLWATVMLLYPLLSVYPQGVIYRAFVMRRYGGLFPGPHGAVVASALAFSAVHVIFLNWIAPLLCLAGGWLFARTLSLIHI